MKSHHLGGWRWGIPKPTGAESDTELQLLAEMENLDLIPSIYSDTGVDYACEVRRSTSSRGPGEDFCTPVFHERGLSQRASADHGTTAVPLSLSW